MEAAGLAISIAALYTTCRDCYSFFTTVKTAEAESSSYRREFEIQQSILKAWGFHWQIHNEDGSEPERPDHIRPKRTKLHDYLLRNRFKAEGVLSTLSALADTLSNQEKLIKRYGIQLLSVQDIRNGSQSTNNVQLTILNITIEDTKPVINEIKNRLSVINKCKWALKDKADFKKLIADLRSHGESLYRLCPENAFESMNIYLTMECLARQESPAGLKWTSKLATQQAKIDEKSSVRKGFELLATAATLKASVNENRGQSDDRILTSVVEEQHEMRYLGKGLALFEGQVVYVEMRDYRGPPLEPTPEQIQQMKRRRDRTRFLKSSLMTHRNNSRLDSRAARNKIYEYRSSSDETEETEEDFEPIEMVRPADPELRALIRNFFNTFQGANMRESVYGLDVAGMIDHTEGEHKGHCSILYKLPGTIGVQSRERPAENLKLRAPVSLPSLLGNQLKQGIRSTLGARFELARKLVRAVCLLHSSGWLHKNIRADSVMFFPEHVSALQEDRYEIKIKIDVSNPILMGYIFSRPDDIVIRIDSPPEPQKESHGFGDRSSRSTHVWDDPTVQKQRSSRVYSIYGRNMVGEVAVPQLTQETNISGFTLDYYQHPAKHADPKRMYRHAYDVYSLGILLLEIGLWEKLTVSKNDVEEDHYERRRWICQTYLDRLRWECGDIYAEVVLSCLMIDSSDDEMANESERNLCARFVAELEGCQA